MGHVRRTESGRWQARYRDPSGRERARNFTRKVDADRFLIGVESDKLRGQWIDPEAARIGLSEVAERWYSTTAPLKPKTRSGYRSLLNSRILPNLGDLQLRQIDPVVVREWVADLQEDGLSASRIRQARNVLHAVFKTAVDGSMINRNPVAGVKTPPVVTPPRRYLTADQVGKLADAIQSPYDLLVLVLTYSGIRFGEAAALRRSDCDLEGSRLHIKESLAEVAGQLHFGTTKTHRQRVVALPASIRDMLEDHLQGNDIASRGLVFTSPKGRPVRYSNFRRRQWTPAIERAGLTGLEIHELRHTAASLMINEGADPKLIQTQLGHSSISITYDIYGHLFPDRLDELAAKLDELIDRDRSRRNRVRGMGHSL
jgi:integrase